MKRLLALVFVAVGLWSSPSHAQVAGSACQASAIYDASTSGSTAIVTGTASGRIFICGFDLFSGGTVNVKLVYGTGGSCGTGTVNITPAFEFTAQTGLVDPSSYWRGLKFVPYSNDLCLNASAGVAVQAVVYYIILP